ncbi:MAG: selenium cofactor biosynthesis protein YqeC [Desulfosporosinus sp.]|nr:selenium cofactor biosynthesis protein YqeC [Desulfosporosinus sp.]
MTSTEIGLPNSWARGSLWDMAGRAQVITFIGAGGKTTCLRALTREIDSVGQRIIATTTTKVFPEESIKSWKNLNPPPYGQAEACFWYTDVMAENGKWIGPSVQTVDTAIASLRTVPDLHWVIEGDGARGLKLKCWAAHEPQIPRRSDCVVLVLDGGLWGQVLQMEQVHRPEACPDLLGYVWKAEQAWRYFLRSPVFAPQYAQMVWVILLNSKVAMNFSRPLLELNHRWAEIQREVADLEYRPQHLRLAAGDAQKGELEWFDLW